MPAALQIYLPSQGELVGLAALFVVASGFALIGGVVAGRRALAELAVLHGWAAVVALFTLVGVMRAVPFTWIAGTAAALAVTAAAWLVAARRRPVDPALLRTALLSAPLFLMIAAMAPSMWDEFTNWLPNVRYLVEQDAFPGPGLPDNPSVFPAYPYGLPLVGYLTSRLAGHFVENAIALFNLLLLLTLGLVVVRVMRAVLAADPHRASAGTAATGEPDRSSWGWCALAALLPTILNPTFVHKIAFTAYADTATAVTLGVAAALGWMGLNALAEDRQPAARALAWQIGLAASALIAVKQVNLVLFAALLGVLLVVALRDRRISARALLPLAPGALVLPLLVYVVWRLYVGAYVPGGEFSIRPPSGWMLALVPDILARMALVASKKGGYFAIMLVAVFFGVRGLWRMRTEFDRLAVITAGLFLVYNAFLLFAYVAAFGEGEARQAASYWRYNMHLGGVCVLFIGYAAAGLWRRYGRAQPGPWAAGAAVALAVFLPLALLGKLRFDLHPRYIYARETTQDIAALLKPADRLLLVDLEQNGQYQIIMRYHLHGRATPVAVVTAFHRAEREPVSETLRTIIERTEATHLWVYRALPPVEAVLGLDLSQGESHLMRRAGGAWRLMRSWPHPS